ncbi:MAG: ketopantoate reductase family protein [Dokdonella sp.]
MNVLILGAGAIGGYYGSRLIDAGAQVTFLLRPKRARELAEHGLRVIRANGEFSAPIRTITSVTGADQYDLVLLSCKAFDLDDAIAAITPAVGDTTCVLPLLNGMRHLDVLDAEFGADRVLGGLCHISVTLEADGSIRQFAPLDRLTFGARSSTTALAPIAKVLRATSIELVESDDIVGAMWSKFALITTLAGITSFMRGSIGEINATAEGVALSRRLYRKCAQVAARSGHPIPAATLAEADRILSTPGSPLKASMLRDIERGAATECEHILGDMLGRANAHGIESPLLAAACTHVRVYEAARAT